MKVFMIGGTGLLGCEAAKILIEKGHEVKSVALPPLPEGAPIPQEMEIIFGDINKKSDDEIKEMLKGCDTFIFAAGVDERVEFPAPVYDAYYKFNIAPLERILPLCKEMGLKRAVVLGSYFSWLAKERPDMPICEKNPYIRSRIEQEKVCESFADENFDVSVLELPYIFGTQPGRRPVWVILIEQLQRFEKMPFTMPLWINGPLPCTRRAARRCSPSIKSVRSSQALPKSMSAASALGRSVCTTLPGRSSLLSSMKPAA